MQGLRIATTTMKKNNAGEGATLPGFRNYKITVKTALAQK